MCFSGRGVIAQCWAKDSYLPGLHTSLSLQKVGFLLLKQELFEKQLKGSSLLFSEFTIARGLPQPGRLETFS